MVLSHCGAWFGVRHRCRTPSYQDVFCGLYVIILINHRKRAAQKPHHLFLNLFAA